MSLAGFANLLLPLAAGTAAFAIFFWILSRRLLARFRRGLGLAIAIGVLLVALLAAALVGEWGYDAARRMLGSELHVSLDSVSRIVQQQIALDVGRTATRLSGLTAPAARALAPGGSLAAFRDEITGVEQFDDAFLEICLVDVAGRPLAVSATGLQAPAPVDRIATAFNFDGKPYVSEPKRLAEAGGRHVLYVSVPVKGQDGQVVASLSAVYDLQTTLETVVRHARFNTSGTIVVVDGDGRVLAAPDASRIGEDDSKNPAVVLARIQESGEVTARNLAGRPSRFVFHQLPVPQTIAPRPWTLLTEIDEGEALAPIAAVRNELVAGLVVIVFVSAIAGLRLSRSLTRPMEEVVDVAQRVQGGDLSQRTRITGRDAIGRLGAAIDHMVAGLEERDRVKDIFGRFIATQVSEELLKGNIDLGGQARQVTILFSDIRGFTTMAETMPPEQVVAFLNEYFSEMVEAVFEQGGVLDKFLGDGLMAVFGSIGEQPDHARRAVAAALRMKALLAKINGERSVAGRPPIQIGIGIHTAEVIVGNIGSRRRLEYTVVGDGVNTASRVQALTKEYHATILVTGATADALGGGFALVPVGEVTLRGKAKALPIFEVVAAAADRAAV
ncbi:MAG TPA: adenylate/guanylate cyclase domain-containing protein [Vicinamibacterales bacterium]|nr:adenylate/guanylate cyclase domain-containing protein [Vicinamibacterales bacterium]